MQSSTDYPRPVYPEEKNKTKQTDPRSVCSYSPRWCFLSIKSVIGPGGGWWYHKIINLGPPRLPHHCCPSRSVLTDPLSTVQTAAPAYLDFSLRRGGCCSRFSVRAPTTQRPPPAVRKPLSGRGNKRSLTAPTCAGPPPAADEPSPAVPLRLYLRGERRRRRRKYKNKRNQWLLRAAAWSEETVGPCYTIAPRLCLTDWRVLLLSPLSDPVIRSSYSATASCVNGHAVSQERKGNGASRISK